MQSVQLSIIIPYNDQMPAGLFPILSLLNAQLGVHFAQIECVVVNGKSEDKLTDEFIGLFNNLYIRSITGGKNKGTGAALQAGLDAAVGEYILFCEPAAYLSSIFVLNAFMVEIGKSRPQLIVSPWLEEKRDEAGNLRSYIQHDADFAYLHGKAFERAFLQQKKIRFHEKLTKYESNYFISLAVLEAWDIRTLSIATFVYRNHVQSIELSVPANIACMGYVLEETQKRCPEQMHGSVCKSILEVYFLLNRRAWRTTENKAHLQSLENTFKDMIKPYFPYYENTSESMLADLYNKTRSISFHDEIEKERFSAWLNRVIRHA